MANYTSEPSFINRLPHLEWKKVLRSSKQFANCPLGADNDSHHPNYVNFSHPRVTIPIVEPNIVDDVHMQQPPSSLLSYYLWYLMLA
jgi:hypothetical protein